MATKSFAADVKKNKGIIEETASISEMARKGKASLISYEKIKDIKLRTNIRDDEYKHAYENIKELADDIEVNGQHTPVLLSKDGYLIYGSRRYEAQKLRGSDEILAYRYHKDSKDISDEELSNLQYSENNERKNIDNFQFSNLLNELLIKNKKYDQNTLAEKFKKSKSYISKVISIKNIDPELVTFLKQFQLYGWSEQKLHMCNLDEKLKREQEKLKGIIGVSKLVAIAKHDSIEQQKKAFLKTYSNRLTPEELESNYFNDIKLDKKAKTVKEKATKDLKGILKYIEESGLDVEEYNTLRKDVERLINKFEKVKV